MDGQIVQITYKLENSRDEYVEENLPYAQPIADTPGLKWKIWIIKEERGEAGGTYFFEDGASVQGFLDGPIISEMKGDPSLNIQTFDVLEELTTRTRGPIQ
jgi:hypothetical protein